jgi:hypothetical protein
MLRERHGFLQKRRGAPGGHRARSGRRGKRDTPSLRDCYQSPVGHAPLLNGPLSVAACRPRGAGIALFAAAMDRPCGHIPGERPQTGIDLGKHTGIGGEPSAVLPPNSALPLGPGIANVTTADPGAQVENVSARGRRTRYQRVPGSPTAVVRVFGGSGCFGSSGCCFGSSGCSVVRGGGIATQASLRVCRPCRPGRIPWSC